MCLITNKKPKIATKDIVVYKLLIPSSKNFAESPYQCFEYELGREYESELTTTVRPRDIIAFCDIDTAYLEKHYGDYSDLVINGELNCYQLGFHSILPHKFNKFRDVLDDTAYECIIPKGSIYVEDFVGCVISSKIIIKGIL